MKKLLKITIGFIVIALVIGILREIIPIQYTLIRVAIFGTIILLYMKFIGLWDLVIKYRNRSKTNE